MQDSLDREGVFATANRGLDQPRETRRSGEVRARALLARFLGERELPEDAQSPAWWLAFLLAAVALALKAPDSLTLPQFWAEDATVFFGQQRNTLWPLFFKPYFGYMNVTPRFVAWCASLLPTVYAPTVFCFSAWIAGSLGLVSLRQLRLSGVPYFLLLAAVVLAPTNGEIFGPLLNVQWLVQFYLLGALARLARGGHTQTPWLRLLLAFVAGLTGPFSLFTAASAAPIVLGSRLLSRRFPGVRRIRWNAELTVISITAVIQLSCMQYFDRPDAYVPVPPVSLDGALNLLAYTQLHTFAAEPFSASTFRLLCIALALFPLVWTRDWSSRFFFVGLYGYSALVFAGVIRKWAGLSVQLGIFEHGDRYYFNSKTLLFWLLAFFVWRVTARSTRLQRGAAILLVLAPLPWSLGRLQRAPYPDLQWKAWAARLDSEHSVVVPLAPIPWQATIVTERIKP